MITAALREIVRLEVRRRIAELRTEVRALRRAALRLELASGTRIRQLALSSNPPAKYPIEGFCAALSKRWRFCRRPANHPPPHRGAWGHEWLDATPFHRRPLTRRRRSCCLRNRENV